MYVSCQYRNPWVLSEDSQRCHDLSVVFMGDSRVRELFKAVLQGLYPPKTKIYR